MQYRVAFSSFLSLCLTIAMAMALVGCPPPEPDGTPPTAGFGAVPVSGSAPLTVQFTDQSEPGTSAISAWTWSFGDGGSSDIASPSHVYSDPGTYTVSLTVSSADGADTEMKTGLITVSADPNWAPDSETFDVDLAPETQFVPESDLEDVVLQFAPEGGAYLLDEDAAQARGLDLDVGETLVLAGLEIGRITRSETDDSGVYIETEPAPLNEVFDNANVAWDYGVSFTPEKVRSIEIPGVGEYPVKAGTPITINYEDGPYKYELQVTLKNTTADFDFKVSKALAGAIKGSFTAKGQIARFRNFNDINIENGQLLSYDHQLNGLRGQAELKLIVAGSGSDAVDFKLPVPILKIPFTVGFIPAVLSVSAQFVINAAVPLEGSSQVSTNFTFDSDIGFAFNGTSVQAGGRAGNVVFGEGINQTGAASAISANFGIGYPRVGLSIAGGTLVPWAQTAFLVGGAYTFTPPCQSADAQFIGAAGYDLGILGFSLASGNLKLFEQKKKLLRAGQCSDSKGFEYETPEQILSERQLSGEE